MIYTRPLCSRARRNYRSIVRNGLLNREDGFSTEVTIYESVNGRRINPLVRQASAVWGRLKIPPGTDGLALARRRVTLNFIVPYWRVDQIFMSSLHVSW